MASICRSPPRTDSRLAIRQRSRAGKASAISSGRPPSPRPPPAGAAPRDAELQVLPYGEVGKDLVALGHADVAACHHLIGPAAGHVLAIEPHLTARQPGALAGREAADRPQRAAVRPVGPEQQRDLTGHGGQRHRMGPGYAAGVDDVQILGGEQGCRRGGRRAHLREPKSRPGRRSGRPPPVRVPASGGPPGNRWRLPGRGRRLPWAAGPRGVRPRIQPPATLAR